MYASMQDTITSVMCSAHRDGSLTFHGKSAEYLITSPPIGRGKTPEAPPFWGDPEEELER
ncbi:hypothetical protein E2C01_035239 [Portunus trituberculatus]|uniref:Uncharacterized protein n=1 Tax=Portunus trituberculatus TaxID=210409 RepID=A0A5B7F981_PORTR|nr:hypothetical protein [Portunus trituberculatus]